MDDKQGPAAHDPEERAFSGHPDHPPAQPNLPADGGEPFRGQQPTEAAEPEAEREPGSPGEATTLPGYGG